MKNFRFKISISFLLFSIFYFLFPILPVYADDVSLGVYPPIIQIDATPPANVEAPFEIDNLADQAQTVSIIFKPFSGNDENGTPFYFSENNGTSINPKILKYVKVYDQEAPIDSLVLAPKQRKQLTLKADIPQGEPRSDYYFSIIFVSKDIAPDNLNVSQGSIGIATNVILSLGPKGKTLGELKEFSSPFFFDKGPVPFTVRIKNSSDHYIAPRGEILIKNVFGQTVGRVDLLPVNILTNSTRAIPDVSYLKDKPILKTNPPSAVWDENMLLGPYTATLTIALSDQGPLFRKTIYFFGFPIQIIIAIFLVIFIVLIVRNRVKRHLQ